MLSLPVDCSLQRSQSSLSIRSRALTTSSLLSACGKIDTRSLRQVYSVDLDALRAKAAGRNDSRPLSLNHVSTIHRTRGTLNLHDLLALARPESGTTRSLRSSLRSLSTTPSSEANVGEIVGIQQDEHWSTDARTLDRASSQDRTNSTRFVPKPNEMCKAKRLANPLTKSIDDVHLLNSNSSPRSPLSLHRQRPRPSPNPKRKTTKLNPKSTNPNESPQNKFI